MQAALIMTQPEEVQGYMWGQVSSQTSPSNPVPISPLFFRASVGVEFCSVLSSTHWGLYTLNLLLNPKGSLKVEFYSFFCYYFKVLSEFFLRMRLPISGILVVNSLLPLLKYNKLISLEVSL
jgi:hypothetical protein